MRKKPKKIEAEAMLELLIQAYPQDVPTRELAARLFGKDSSNARAGIYRMARSLRDLGYGVAEKGPGCFGALFTQVVFLLIFMLVAATFPAMTS